MPDLPGCIAAADLKEEIMKLIQEAIEYHIERLKADNVPIPRPSSRVEFIEVAALQIDATYGQSLMTRPHFLRHN